MDTLLIIITAITLTFVGYRLLYCAIAATPFFGKRVHRFFTRRLRRVKNPFPHSIERDSLLRGDARHRRLAPFIMCSVRAARDSPKTRAPVRANKSVPSPYANAFGFAPAVA